MKTTEIKSYSSNNSIKLIIINKRVFGIYLEPILIVKTLINLSIKLILFFKC